MFFIPGETEKPPEPPKPAPPPNSNRPIRLPDGTIGFKRDGEFQARPYHRGTTENTKEAEAPAYKPLYVDADGDVITDRRTDLIAEKRTLDDEQRAFDKAEHAAFTGRVSAIDSTSGVLQGGLYDGESDKSKLYGEHTSRRAVGGIGSLNTAREKNPNPAIDVSTRMEGVLTQVDVDRNRARRLPYFEAREAITIQRREFEVIDKIIGAEMREKCRPEIDDYINCIVDRYFSLPKCTTFCHKMRRCMKYWETPEAVARRRKEIMNERLDLGVSLLRADERAQYNKMFAEDQDEWFQADWYEGKAVAGQVMLRARPGGHEETAPEPKKVDLDLDKPKDKLGGA